MSYYIRVPYFRKPPNTFERGNSAPQGPAPQASPESIYTLRRTKAASLSSEAVVSDHVLCQGRWQECHLFTGRAPGRGYRAERSKCFVELEG